ncbi:rhomboid family intramembrane serine protease [Marinagarivorans algicola]|uniref:rhomboid family intramembrane serine protease n=1 Tax=Marinagarivorans algicola TaxID=1513270 RepID=UPI0006B8C5D9|nr:rhomboid family intramembrane serine protease [Marinagarivorans algicola]
MKAVCLARFPAELNLSPLDKALTEHNILHRFTEEQQEQVLWLANEASVAQAVEVIKRFLSASAQDTADSSFITPPLSVVVSDTVNDTEEGGHVLSGVFTFIKMAPITVALIVLGAIGYCIVAMPWLTLYQLMTFTPIKIVDTRLFVAPWQWQESWRALSPIFLHFGIGHIIFNAMAMLQMGSWVERLWGFKWYALVCLCAALAGNGLQYFWDHSPMFGGLSGVVYGVFTFNYITQRVNPTKAFILPRAMYIWLAVFLLAGFTPFFTLLFGVQVANGAHLGGALGGALTALVANRKNLMARRQVPKP